MVFVDIEMVGEEVCLKYCYFDLCCLVLVFVLCLCLNVYKVICDVLYVDDFIEVEMFIFICFMFEGVCDFLVFVCLSFGSWYVLF